MPAWNLPRSFMNLSAITGGGAALAAATALRCWRGGHPLAAAALAHAAAAGAAVAVASSAPLQRRCVGLFGKDWRSGRVGWAAYLALWPYQAGVAAAYWLYHATSGEERTSRIADGLYLGCWPQSAGELPASASRMALLDVTNELHAKVQDAAAYHALPAWETWLAPPAELQAAVAWALRQRQAGRAVLVYCTHGHGRSAAVAAALLLAGGQAGSAEEALRRVKAARPGASPNRRQVEALHEWAAAYGHAVREG